MVSWGIFSVSFKESFQHNQGVLEDYLKKDVKKEI